MNGNSIVCHITRRHHMEHECEALSAMNNLCLYSKTTIDRASFYLFITIYKLTKARTVLIINVESCAIARRKVLSLQPIEYITVI